MATEFAGEKKRVVVLGAGFGGASCAQELTRRAPNVEVVVLDRNNYTLFYPLLVEAGVGTLEPRHVTVPFRAQAPKADFRMAEVLGIDPERKRVRFRVIGGDAEEEMRYDHLVFGLGSVTKVPTNVPGLKEHGFELKALVDAIGLRDRGIRLLELANTLSSHEARRALLTFVVVGANFTGIEFAGEYHAFLQDACRRYPNVRADEIRTVVLEFADRILPGTTESLARWCSDTLTKRGIEIRTKTSLSEIGEEFAQATDGERIPTRTVLWAAGIAPSPLLREIAGFPTNERGYVQCERDLRVTGFSDAWAIGDSATVLDENGKPYAATAQNASRQGPHCARNLLATMRGEETKPFSFTPLGNFAAIGHRQAAAQVFGRELRGFLGWVVYRGAYLMKMPTLKLKLRLVGDWIGELLIPHEPVQVGVHDERSGNGPGDAEATTSEMPRAFVK